MSTSEHMTPAGGISAPNRIGARRLFFVLAIAVAELMAVMVAMALYVGYRMTQRQSVYAEEDDYDAVAYAPVLPTGTAIAVEAAQEYYAENAEADPEVSPTST